MSDAYDVFRGTVLAYYKAHGRHDLPWRLPEPDGSFDPYKILVSEIMLQQTQVPRVLPKYSTFLGQFPTIAALARAPLGEVLVAWQGLGYNRRAKFLWQAAGMVAHESGGVFPRTRAELERLPGIGANTAGAILAYVYNEPAIFVETNIRTVFIHHFLRNQTSVPDGPIKDALQKVLQGLRGDGRYRVFFWALMDYGTYLKQTLGNAARLSSGYKRQSRFDGSPRQLRGRALRLLAAGPQDHTQLLSELADPRAAAVLRSLAAEGLIREHSQGYELP